MVDIQNHNSFTSDIMCYLRTMKDPWTKWLVSHSMLEWAKLG